MKKIIVAALGLCLLSAGAVHAGRKCGGKKKWSPEKVERRIDKRVGRMTKKLDLSDSQASKLRALLTKRADKRQALMKAHHKRMKALRAGSKSGIEAILDAEQKEKFAAMKKKHKKKHGVKGRKGRRGRRR